MSLRNLIHQPPPPDDFSKRLGPDGIKTLLNLMRDAYFELLRTKIIHASMSENDITEEWFVWIQLLWRESNAPWIPIHEKPDKSKAKKRGRPPTIDFCFRNQWDKRSYFGTECKLVEANSKTLCDKYIENGVKRFIRGIYSQQSPAGAMVGYVRKTKSNDVANELRGRINALENSSGLEKTDFLLPFEEHYLSSHKRETGISPFEIHHLLLLFT